MHRSQYFLLGCFALAGGAGAASGSWAAGDAGTLYNPEAVVPPQCYTRHEGRFNPCYVCHQSHDEHARLNQMDDQRLQSEYDFAEVAFRNHWTNLFVDRRPAMAKITDAEIHAWVAEDNFAQLAPRLDASGWGGYVPRLANLAAGPGAFDDRGLARDGSGWVAFNYKPLPSTFWPTNGSADDVMIRLPERFRTRRDGQPDADIYFLNLALVEAAVKDLDAVPVAPVDERSLGVDIDGDGGIAGTARRLARRGHYFGAAEDDPVHRFLYPAGTEFLHTVRYVGFREGHGVVPARRMKEVRYMRKHTLLPPEEVRARYRALKAAEENGGEDDSPVALRDAGDLGFDNGFGWYVQGFIEDADGRLRPQTHEEGLFCMGCHRSIGATIDHTFAYPRKVTGPEGFGYIDLKGMPDAPLVGERAAEILQYFQRVGGGDEFRENRELRAKFFTDHEVRVQKVLRADVYDLIAPSAERARALNKAYLTVVREQSFVRGREGALAPMVNVYRAVDPETAPTLPPERQYRSDIRLDWGRTAAP